MRILAKACGVAAVGALLSCGSGGGGGGVGGDLTGAWLLTPATDGIDGDAIHVSLTSTGTAVAGEATCNATWPVGAGSWDGTTFLLTFDFGGGDALSLSGGASGSRLVGTYAAPDGPGTFALERTAIVLDCARACDPVVVAPFVDVDFTELDKVEQVSLFRSSAGHSYTDDCEDCRSLKHYFAPYANHLANGDVAVRSPVAGTIVSVTAEGHGASVGLENKQVRIRSTLRPDVTFILFHVDCVPGTAAGNVVAAGDPIGTARLVYPDIPEVAHDFDIAVRVHTLYGDRYVSWFDVVSDALFATYVARGASARSDFVISRGARDADPLTCSGETFTSTGSLGAWFVLDPP
jgi:hypothetical protein